MLTKEQKIEVLKDYLKMLDNSIEKYGLFEKELPKYAQAQQWLAEIEAENDGWVNVEDGTTKNGTIPYHTRILLFDAEHSDMPFTGYYNEKDFVDEDGYVHIGITHFKIINPPKK